MVSGWYENESWLKIQKLKFDLSNFYSKLDFNIYTFQNQVPLVLEFQSFSKNCFFRRRSCRSGNIIYNWKNTTPRKRRLHGRLQIITNGVDCLDKFKLNTTSSVPSGLVLAVADSNNNTDDDHHCYYRKFLLISFASPLINLSNANDFDCGCRCHHSLRCWRCNPAVEAKYHRRCCR